MLNLMQDGQVISTVAEGGWLSLPSGDVVSPAADGWTDGVYSLVAVPPDPEPTPEELLQAERAGMRLSFSQMLIGLVTENWISEADGEVWLSGTLPPTVLATINLLPESQRFAAKAKAARPSYVDRLDPLVGMMAMAQGRSDAEVDAFFRTYIMA
jgi:hypothetical protein